MTIRPIIDEHSSYSKFFVEIVQFVAAIIHCRVAFAASESIFERLNEFIGGILIHEGNFRFVDLEGLYQELALVGEDLIKLVIRLK